MQGLEHTRAASRRFWCHQLAPKGGFAASMSEKHFRQRLCCVLHMRSCQDWEREAQVSRPG